MSDQDPAVRTWQEAIESQLDDSALSTSAYARRLGEELDRLRADYNDVLLTRAALERELAEVREAAARNVVRLTHTRRELTLAVQEIVRLRAAQGGSDG